MIKYNETTKKVGYPISNSHIDISMTNIQITNTNSIDLQTQNIISYTIPTNNNDNTIVSHLYTNTNNHPQLLVSDNNDTMLNHNLTHSNETLQNQQIFIDTIDEIPQEEKDSISDLKNRPNPLNIENNNIEHIRKPYLITDYFPKIPIIKHPQIIDKIINKNSSLHIANTISSTNVTSHIIDNKDHENSLDTSININSNNLHTDTSNKKYDCNTNATAASNKHKINNRFQTNRSNKNDIWGSAMTTKDTNTTRIYFQNVNSLRVSNKHNKWKQCCDYAKTSSMDIFGFAETCVNWKINKTKTTIQNETKQYYDNCSIALQKQLSINYKISS